MQVGIYSREGNTDPTLSVPAPGVHRLEDVLRRSGQLIGERMWSSDLSGDSGATDWTDQLLVEQRTRGER